MGESRRDIAEIETKRALGRLIRRRGYSIGELEDYARRLGLKEDARPFDRAVMFQEIDLFDEYMGPVIKNTPLTTEDVVRGLCSPTT